MPPAHARMLAAKGAAGKHDLKGHAGSTGQDPPAGGRAVTAADHARQVARAPKAA
jgi:hypothetical protein